MLFAIGIKVASRGLEVGRVALRVLMKVDGMFAGRQILHLDIDFYSRSRVRQNGRTHDVALSIFELNHSLGGTSGCECDHEQCEGEQASGFHAGDYT
jgi:hypothetical protein